MNKIIVFGTGPVGLHSANELMKMEQKVTLVNRSGTLSPERRLLLPPESAGCWDIIAAQATDADQVRNAVEGATHIFHCVNPQYYQWAEILPAVQKNLIDAAVAGGAVLAVSENLYMYRRGVDLIDLDTPVDPPSRKGTIRRDLHSLLVEAGKERGLKWVSVRGSDYYGPGAGDQSMFGTAFFLDPLFNGRKATGLGNPDADHSYTYLPDFGRALAELSLNPESYGRPWIVTHREVTSSRELGELFMKEAQRQVKVASYRKGALRLLGIFDRTIRELVEMIYQKEEAYRVSGRQLEETFNFAPTSMEEGVRETLQWYNEYRGLKKV